jgi:hypothetical protein
MPIRRFRSVEEMTEPDEQRLEKGAGLLAAIRLSRTCLAFRRRRPAPGVHKFRSVEEAWEARQRWERESSS